MKKLNVVMSAFLAALIFITSYYSFNSEYGTYRSSFHLKPIDDIHDDDSFLVSMVLNEEYVESKEQLVKELIEFSDTYNIVSIIVSPEGVYEGISLGIYHYYGPFINNYLSRVYYKDKITDFDFNDLTSKTVLSNTELAKNIYDDVRVIDSLDNTSIDPNLDFIRIHRSFGDFMNDTDNKLNSSLSFYLIVRKQDYSIEEALSAIDENLRVIRPESSNPDLAASFVFDDWMYYQSPILETLNRLIQVVAVILLMNSIILYFQRRNEVSIRKLYGNSEVKIFTKVFLKDFIAPSFVFSTVILSLLLFFVFPIRPISIEFMLRNIGYIRNFILASFLVLVIMFGFSLVYNRKILLKNKDTISNFVQLNLIVKVILLVVIAVPFSTIADRFQTDFISFSVSSSMLNKFENIVTIEGMGESESFEVVNEKIKNVHNLLSEQGFYYVYNHDYYGQSVINDENKEVPLYIVRVNENYLETMSPLYDENGTVINLDSLDSDVDILFIHESMRDSDYQIETQLICRECELVFYYNQVNEKLDTYFDRHIEDRTGYGKNVYGSVFENPIIFLPRNAFKIDGNSYPAQYYRELNEDYTIDDYSRFLEDVESYISIAGLRADVRLRIEYDAYLSAVLEGGFYIAVILLTIISLTLQYTYAYFVNQSKRLALQYLHGIAFIKRYYMVYIINTLIYYVVYLYAKRNLTTYIVFVDGTIMKTLLVLALFDSIIITFIFKYMERKNFEKALKGGD